MSRPRTARFTRRTSSGSHPIRSGLASTRGRARWLRAGTDGALLRRRGGRGEGEEHVLQTRAARADALDAEAVAGGPRRDLPGGGARLRVDPEACTAGERLLDG